MSFQQSTLARNGEGDAFTAAVGNAGKLSILTGAVPANCAAAETGTLLAQHTLGSPFAPAASGGVVSPTLPANVNAVATGTAGYYRVYKADGTTCVGQAPIADITLNTTAIVLGGPVAVNSWSITIGGA